MKKLLIKLSSITITGAMVPSPMISTIVQKFEQEIPAKSKREVPSKTNTFNILHKTYDIGEIETNTPAVIEDRFRNYLQTHANLDNYINIEQRSIITTNIRTRYADINISNEENERTEIIARVNFTVTRRIILSSIIRNTNLGQIPDNSEATIINILYQQNPELRQLSVGIRTISITLNSAIISYYGIRMQGAQGSIHQITITFTTTNYALTNFITNSDLGELPDAREETIRNAIRERNPNIPADFNFGTIENISLILENNMRRRFSVTLTSEHELQEVPQIIIYNESNIESLNYFFNRPATQQEIERNENIIIFASENSINFYFSINDNNTQSNTTNTEEGDNQDHNISSSFFCLDSEISKMKKRNTELNSNCSTSVNNFKIINDDTKGGNIKPGDAYLTTNNGVYLEFKDGKAWKFKDINEKIIDIKLDGNGSAVVATESKKVYQLNLYGWGSEQLSFESDNLNKKLNLYFHVDKSNKELTMDWKQTQNHTSILIFNMGKINPADFDNLEFIDNHKNFFTTKASWGNEAYYSGTNLFDLTYNKQFKIKDKLKNVKITEELLNSEDFKDIFSNGYLTVDKDQQTSGLASIKYEQLVGISYYWENENYYLQVIAQQKCNSWKTWQGGSLFLNLGNGLTLNKD